MISLYSTSMGCSWPAKRNCIQSYPRSFLKLISISVSLRLFTTRNLGFVSAVPPYFCTSATTWPPLVMSPDLLESICAKLLADNSNKQRTVVFLIRLFWLLVRFGCLLYSYLEEVFFPAIHCFLNRPFHRRSGSGCSSR